MRNTQMMLLSKKLVYSQPNRALHSLPSTFYSAKHHYSAAINNNTETCDIAIIGSGIMGLNTAYQIARRSPNTKIKLFEQSPGPGYGSSGASSAICRTFYTLSEMVRFSKCGMNYYQNWTDYLQYKDASASYTKCGTMVLSPMTKTEVNEKVRHFKSFGCDMRAIDKNTMETEFGQINSDCGEFDNNGEIEWEPKPMTNNDYFLMEDDAGYFEPVQALSDLVHVLRRNYSENVDLYYNNTVKEILHNSGKINGLKTEKGDTVHCKYVINCSGPWYHKIIDQFDGLDIKFTLSPVRIQVIYKDCPELFEQEHLDCFLSSKNTGHPIPVITDLLSGSYFRTQSKSKQILVSTLKGEEETDIIDPDAELPNGADPEFRNKYLNSFYHRLEPIVEPTSSKVHSLSGMYTVCEDDVHYLIGPTKLDGLIVCNGFSGHGFKCGPAVGSMLAQYLTNTKMYGDTDVPIDFFSPYRTPYEMAVKNVMA